MDNNNELAITRKNYALSKYSNGLEFIKGMNAAVCRDRYVKIETVSDCLTSKAPTFPEISEWYGSDCPADLVGVHLHSLNLFVNVGNKLLNDQVKEIAYWIVEKFPNLNLAELTLVLTRIKMGNYGPLYNNLSGEFILNCFKEYAKEKRAWEYKSEQEKPKAFPTIQDFGAALISNIDKMPNVKKLLDEARIEKEQKAVEELNERKTVARRLLDYLS